MTRSTLPLFLTAIAASAPALAAEAVPVPNFESVQLRGGGTVIVVPGPTKRVTIVEGSTRYTSVRVERGGRLRIDACNNHCPRVYRLRVEIQSPDVPDLAVTGGGSIMVR